MPTLGQQLHQTLANGYAGRIQGLATRFGTTDTNVCDTLLDPAFDLVGSWNAGTFTQDVTNPLNFASCYPTAQHLFPVLTGPAAQVVHGANPAGRYNDANALRAELNNLIARIREAESTPFSAVFRLELAGHGFTLIARHDESNAYWVELIECLAHHTSLTVSLTFAPKTVNEVVQALQRMFSDDINTRIAGAATMGWNATGLYLGHQYNADPVFPNIIFRWWAAPLDAGWQTRWVAELDSRMTFLETH